VADVLELFAQFLIQQTGVRTIDDISSIENAALLYVAAENDDELGLANGGILLTSLLVFYFDIALVEDFGQWSPKLLEILVSLIKQENCHRITCHSFFTKEGSDHIRCLHGGVLEIVHLDV
jgi:hypothetical protein